MLLYKSLKRRLPTAALSASGKGSKYRTSSQSTQLPTPLSLLPPIIGHSHRKDKPFSRRSHELTDGMKRVGGMGVKGI